MGPGVEREMHCYRSSRLRRPRYHCEQALFWARMYTIFCPYG